MAESTQFRGTGSGTRAVSVPSSASNQLKISTDGVLKSTSNFYTKTIIGPCNQDPNLDGFQPSGRNRKSPTRAEVGVGTKAKV